MTWTTIVAFITGSASLGAIYCMAYHELDKGLGFATIGIITFFGTAVSSSIFEEHRHNHGYENSNKVFVGKDVSETTRELIKNARFEPLKTIIDKEKEIWTNDSMQKIQDEYEKEVEFTIVNPNDPSKDDDGNFIHGVIAGTGIMRKALAASLVITYIVLIGFSYSDGSLHTQISSVDTNQTQTMVMLNNTLYDNGTGITKKILDKNPTTLIQHFTIVVSVVIGFYFSTNAYATYLDKKKDDTKNNDKQKLRELQKKLKDEIPNISDQNLKNTLQKISDDLEKSLQ